MLEELVNATYGQLVHDDIAYAKKLGVTEIPVFFINGEMVAGKPTYENLSKEIDAALKKVKPAKKVTKQSFFKISTVNKLLIDGFFMLQNNYTYYFFVNK